MINYKYKYINISPDGYPYLERNRFLAIMRMLNSSMASWDIQGEVIDGEPISEDEIKFVIEQLKKRGQLRVVLIRE